LIRKTAKTISNNFVSSLSWLSKQLFNHSDMKTKILSLVMIVLMVFTFIAPTQAVPPVDKLARKTEMNRQAEAQLIEMRARVAEIKAMDKSKLTKAERKALRKELREMNKKARALGSGGVYLSVGAIILIILVLILIL